MHTETENGSDKEAQTIAASDVGNLADVLATPHEEGTAPAEAPKLPVPENGHELILRLIGQIEELHRAIQHGFGTPAFMNGVVERLATSEVLAPLIDRLILERLTLMQQAAQPPEDPTPKVLDMRAVLFLTVEDEANRDLKVARLAANHPTNPGGIEAYIRDGDHWHVSPLGELATKAIHTAMTEVQAQPGDFYWVEFFQITDRPVPGLPNQRLNAAGEVVVDEVPAETESAPEGAELQSTDSPTA